MIGCKKHPHSERYNSGACKGCSAEATLRWREKHPEKAKANSARWRAANPEKARAAYTRWRADNADRNRANAKAWRAANPEKAKALWRRKGYRVAGMDPMLAEAALAAHKGACECCGTTRAKGKGWCVDHEHQTGRIRGVLCTPCNLAIGQLGDTLEGVLRAVKYLQRNQE